MARLVLNRTRELAPRGGAAANMLWEHVNEIAYILGSALFIIGSVFFLPSYGKELDFGVSIFVVGSLLYMGVTGHDLFEVLRYRRAHGTRGHDEPNLQVAAAIGYVTGGALHLGSDWIYLFDPTLVRPSAWLSLIGSVLFLVAGVFNVLGVVNAPSRQIMQLTNLTAVSFVMGSVLFTVGSFPDFWHEATVNDRDDLMAFVAWLYIIGSAVFLAGGVFNYRRAVLVNRMLSDPLAERTRAEGPIKP